MEGMRIGQIIQGTGLSASILRYYGREGLVSAARNGAGKYLYDAQDVSWIRSLQRLRTASMPIGLTHRHVQPYKTRPPTFYERLELLYDYEVDARSRIAEFPAYTDVLDAKTMLYRQRIDDAEDSGQTHIPGTHRKENDGRKYRQEPDRKQ